MRADLITIFPGIVLATKIWDLDKFKEIESDDALNDITYNKTRIVSYRKLSSEQKPEDIEYLNEINLIHPKIIDTDSKTLDDYTIVIDKDIQVNSLNPPTHNSQHLITYFFLQSGLDHIIDLGFIKIIRFRGGGRNLSVNNKMRFFSEILLFLPYKHIALQKLLIHKEREKVLIDILNVLHNRNPKVHDRILNAIALYNESCRISKYNANSSIVLMVSAFESLLQLPKSSTSNFGYAFKTLWRYDDDIEKWAKALYQLRCYIVHGEVVEEEKLFVLPERHYPYFQIAKFIFHSCLLSVLSNYGYIVLEKDFKDKMIRRFKNLITSNKEKVDWLIKHSKNFTYKSFLKNYDLYQKFISRIDSLTPTDYSARSISKKLLNHILKIAEDWIVDKKKLNNRTLQKEIEMNDVDVKKHIKDMNEKLSKIQLIIADIKALNLSPDKIFMIENSQIRNLQETIEKLEPGIYAYHEKTPFSLGFFITRCLHSLR